MSAAPPSRIGSAQLAGTPALSLLDVDVSSVGRWSDVLAETMRGEHIGLVLRGAFPADALAQVVSRLESGACRLRRHESPHYRGVAYGGIVVLAGEDLDAYFDEGAEFPEGSAALFEGVPDYQTRIEQLLARLSGGRQVAVPRAPDGRPYMASSIRGVAPDGAIDLHCENETLGFTGMRHLVTLIDTRDQLSFYLTLALPETGGDISISALKHAEGPGRELLNMERDTDETIRAIEPHGSIVPRLDVGDLLIFDAGRHYHRVTPVGGGRMRWTMGGFLALSTDHSTLFYWS